MERKSAWKKVVTQNNIRWKLLSFTPTTRTKSSNWWREGWQSTYTNTPSHMWVNKAYTWTERGQEQFVFKRWNPRLEPKTSPRYHIKFHEPSSRTKSPN
jgi:hypothetical protein